MNTYYVHSQPFCHATLITPQTYATALCLCFSVPFHILPLHVTPCIKKERIPLGLVEVTAFSILDTSIQALSDSFEFIGAI